MKIHCLSCGIRLQPPRWLKEEDLEEHPAICIGCAEQAQITANVVEQVPAYAPQYHSHRVH